MPGAVRRSVRTVCELKFRYIYNNMWQHHINYASYMNIKSLLNSYALFNAMRKCWQKSIVATRSL